MNILKLLLTDHTFRTVAMGCTLLGIVSGMIGLNEFLNWMKK